MSSDPLVLLSLFSACIGACALSAFLTGLLRSYALRAGVVDTPNERSSHSIPTPRGGGVAIVFSFLFCLLLLLFSNYVEVDVVVAFLLATMISAAIGFLDDHRPVKPSKRLLVHFASSIFFLPFVEVDAQFLIGDIAIGLGPAWYVAAALYVVWLLNLYNFMDGIDGIAGVEAVTVCLSGAILAWYLVPGSISAILSVTLLFCVLGFLFWNFPPAKIFMGDAGSGFLGVTLAGISLLAASESERLFFAWVILLGVFIVDASLTLFRRVLRGEKPHEAHRTHAYQYASRKFNQHKIVSLSVGAINLLWLFPVAFLVVAEIFSGLIGVLVAYFPLVLIAFWFRAGVREGNPP